VVTPKVSSGLTASESVDPTSTGCTLSANSVMFVSAGTCVIDVNQLGDTTFAAAPQVQLVTIITRQTQTLTGKAPTTGKLGGSYMLSPTASSGLAVNVTVDPASTGCTLTTDTVTFNAAGACIIDLNQPGNTQYLPAPELQLVTAIGEQAQTITATAPKTGLVGGSYTLSPTASSGLAVNVTVDPASTGCTLTTNTVTFNAAGACVIDLNQPGNGQFAPAPQRQLVTVITRNPQTITAKAPTTGLIGNSYTLTPTATSTLPVSITVDPTSIGCTLTGTTITFTATGNCVIDTNQPGNTQYLPAPQHQLDTLID
jgi:hypothetical protein